MYMMIVVAVLSIETATGAITGAEMIYQMSAGDVDSCAVMEERLGQSIAGDLKATMEGIWEERLPEGSNWVVTTATGCEPA